ncbi:MAG: hypothetical protein K8S56_08265 [Candidatus Cloacimonetes bacterium]|nr:hypothetical protein [Candidatus Cloacimonadota bacterium]
MSTLKHSKQMQEMQWLVAPESVFEPEPLAVVPLELENYQWRKYMPTILMSVAWVALYSIAMILDQVKQTDGFFLSSSLAQQYPLTPLQSIVILVLLVVSLILCIVATMLRRCIRKGRKRCFHPGIVLPGATSILGLLFYLW